MFFYQTIRKLFPSFELKLLILICIVFSEQTRKRKPKGSKSEKFSKKQAAIKALALAAVVEQHQQQTDNNNNNNSNNSGNDNNDTESPLVDSGVPMIVESVAPSTPHHINSTIVGDSNGKFDDLKIERSNVLLT